MVHDGRTDTPTHTMEHDDLRALVERSQKEFVSTFAADYNRLVDLAEAAGSGDSAALVELQLAAHRLVGRAGILQFLAVARHASALETLARVGDVRHFDRGAASACLVELREAFVEVRAGLSATTRPLDGTASTSAPVRALVLVADDDDDQRYLLTRVLQRAGFEVIAAATGKEALALARERKPAAILLDVQMPDQDGPTTGRLLKAERATASIPLMFLSATSDAADRAAGGGADDYVSKSIDPRELIGRVRAMCARLRPSSG